MRDWERKRSPCAVIRKPHGKCEGVGLSHRIAAVDRGDGRRTSFRFMAPEIRRRVAAGPACSERSALAPLSQRQRADRQRPRQQRSDRLESAPSSGNKRRDLSVPRHPLDACAILLFGGRSNALILSHTHRGGGKHFPFFLDNGGAKAPPSHGFPTTTMTWVVRHGPRNRARAWASLSI